MLAIFFTKPPYKPRVINLKLIPLKSQKETNFD